MRITSIKKYDKDVSTEVYGPYFIIDRIVYFIKRTFIKQIIP